MSVFGEELRDVRMDKGLSGKGMAGLLGMVVSTYSQIETGRIRSNSKYIAHLVSHDIFTVNDRNRLMRALGKMQKEDKENKECETSVFGKALKDLRHNKMYTQQQFAEKLGVKATSYYTVEAGSVRSGSSVLAKIIGSPFLTEKERKYLSKALQTMIEEDVGRKKVVGKGKRRNRVAEKTKEKPTGYRIKDNPEFYERLHALEGRHGKKSLTGIHANDPELQELRMLAGGPRVMRGDEGMI